MTRPFRFGVVAPVLTDMHVVGVTTLNEAIDAAFGTD